MEAVLAQLIEKEGGQDEHQGGFTKGVSAIGQVFAVWTLLAFRCKYWSVPGFGSVPTFVCFVDMTAFFDTILPKVVVAQWFLEGIGARILQFINKMYNNVWCSVRTGAGTSRAQHMYPGFRQGRRGFEAPAPQHVLLVRREADDALVLRHLLRVCAGISRWWWCRCKRGTSHVGTSCVARGTGETAPWRWVFN